jgi:DNA repair exonuclease SbcCD ATPase subunit
LKKRGYEQEKVRISPILDSISRSIGSYENDIKNYQEREEEIKKNERVVELIGLKKNILQDYGKYLFRYLKPKIEEIASSYFSTATNHKYAKISIEEDYRIMIDEKELSLYSG